MSQIQQTARDGEIDLFYFDEAGFACMPNVQRSWSPLGQPHTADASLGRTRAHVVGALDYTRAQLHFEVCDHSIRREHVVRFIDQLAKSSPPDKWAFLILDNASTHHHIDPVITNRWLVEHRFLLLYLPPYSPELNLIEILWKHAKYHWRAFVSLTKDSLLQEVQALLAGFGKNFHIRYA